MLVSMTELWLPILLATLAAWLASVAMHMIVKFHDSDYQELSNEADVAATLRDGALKKGIHSMPYCTDMKLMGTSEMQAKFKQGPVAFVTIFDNGMPPMGKLILQQVLYFLFGMALIAYCATLALAPGSDYLDVFRIVSSIGFLAFGWAQIPMSIWYGHLWTTTVKYLIDGLIYGLLAAGVFAWLWPLAN
ncbi:MAG: hypothetical protein AB8F65_09850 [Woeseiaceae bacterium]